MKRFASVASAAALLVTLAATEPQVGGTTTATAPAATDVPTSDVSAYVGADGSTAALVVEPVAGQEDAVASGLLAAGQTILRSAGGAFEVAPSGADLASLPGVASVGPAERAVASATGVTAQQLTAATSPPSHLVSARTGANGAEGADAIGVPAWRDAGLTGWGTKLAVIDTGFGQWAQATASGDVAPKAFDASHDLDLCDAGFEHTNHGTATSEIVYDVAPDVDLYRVCIDDAVDLAQAVPWLITQQVEVVNMSLGFYNTGRGDGDGGPRSPEQSVRQAIAAGVLWVNSAGNEALLHWAGPFTDANGDGRHEWAAGEPTMSFTLPPKAPVTVYLKWDEWTGPTDDFALCLATTPTATPQCYPGGAPAKGTPVVSVGLTNPFEQEATLYASVQRISGTGAPRLDAFFLGAGQIQHPVAASSLAEPAAVPGVVAVGAVCTRDDVIRPYSSEGPTLDGRAGITVVAPGSISSAVVGPASDCQGGYGGTSAAAPHVAASLALVRQGLPYAAPEGVLAELLDRVRAAGDPGPPGVDPIYGFGVLKLGRPDTLSSSSHATTTTTEPPTTTTQAPGTTVPPTTSTTSGGDQPVGSYGLGVGDGADRSNARPLAGQTLSGASYVFVTPVWPAVAPDVVRFSVDGRLVQVERQSGFDLGGGTADAAYPFDTFRLTDGPHVLEARLRFADGHDEVVSAPFSVDNRGRVAPARPFQLLASTDSAGSGARPLDGATLAGPTYLSLSGTSPIAVDHVLFYVDAGLSGYDQDAPYAVGPVDVSALGPGEHMSQVIVYLVDGSIVTVNGTFTVS